MATAPPTAMEKASASANVLGLVPAASRVAESPARQSEARTSSLLSLAAGCATMRACRRIGLRLSRRAPCGSARLVWLRADCSERRQRAHRRHARRALLDRAQGAGAAERQTGRSLRRDLRRLAWLHQRILAGLEVRHLDLAAEHIDTGSPLSTVTRNCVPFTTAARYGVSTSKCLTLRFSTSSRIEPACWMMVVDSPVFPCSWECRSPNSARSRWSLRRAPAARGRSGRCGCCRRASGSRLQSAPPARQPTS